MNKINDDDYAKKIEAEASHFSKVAAESQTNSDKVQRFSPKVQAFDEAMNLYRNIFYEKMPHMALDNYILDYALENSNIIKIISLGCGTGDWELELVEKNPQKIHMNLVEINDDILKYAREYAKKHNLSVKTIVQDVNKLNLEKEQYDFIVVRSSLHHFVELEHIFTEINMGLKSDGKFLVMGEVIGRNGQLLYDETRDIVEKIMTVLPEKFRFNHNTGKIDKKFPQIDYAKDSFEAIRSEDIYRLILEYFDSIEYITFDAIISYLLDFRYGPNYDLDNNLDKSIIQFIVQMDMYYLQNRILKPTSLFGIFVKK